MSKGIARGSADGPRYIYGKENVNWGGPKRAAKLKRPESNINQIYNDISKSQVRDINDPVSQEIIEECLFDISESYKNDNEPIKYSDTKTLYDDLNDISKDEIEAFRQQFEELNDKNDVVGMIELAREISVSPGMSTTRATLKTIPDVAARKDIRSAKNACFKTINGYMETFAKCTDKYQEAQNSDLFREDLTGKPIGDLKAIALYESNSYPWHRQRQKGIGGSDYNLINNTGGYKFRNGKIIQNDEEYGGGNRHHQNYYYHNGFDNCWDSKVRDITEQASAEMRNKFNGGDYTHAMTQGNAQEDLIAEIVSRTRGISLGHTKNTYKKDTGVTQINYDYLTVDEHGKPTGTMEIKTTKDPDNYGDESLGIDGLSSTVRAQALAQCYEGDFEKGALAVLINGSELRVFQWDMTNELKEEARQNQENATRFFNAAQIARKRIASQGGLSDMSKKVKPTEEDLQNIGVNIDLYKQQKDSIKKRRRSK